VDKEELAGSPDGAPSEEVLERIRVPFVQRAVIVHREQEETAFVIDLGLAGVFVERHDPIPVGEAVEVRFRVPGNEILVRARCRVAWWHPAGSRLVSKSLPPGVGLEFVEIAETDRARIRGHLAEHLRRHGRARSFARQWPTGRVEGENS
jgi:Tfp pilus assembly protein PilZ